MLSRTINIHGKEVTFEQPEDSKGVLLVGQYNPEGKAFTENVKTLSSLLIDLIQERINSPHTLPDGAAVLEAAKLEILKGQMLAVKSMYI